MSRKIQPADPVSLVNRAKEGVAAINAAKAACKAAQDSVERGDWEGALESLRTARESISQARYAEKQARDLCRRMGSATVNSVLAVIDRKPTSVA